MWSSFSGPGNTTLYEGIDPQWNFATISTLLRSFESNPKSSSLVRSVRITCFQNLWTVHPFDTNPTGTPVAFVQFLASLNNIKHLSMKNYRSRFPLSSINQETSEHLDRVMSGLKSLRLESLIENCWKRVYFGATSLRVHDIRIYLFPSFESPQKHM